MPKQNKFRDLPHSRQHSNPKNMRRATLMVWGITCRHVVEMYSSLSIYYLDSDIEPSPLGTLIHSFNSTSPWLLIVSVFNSFSASAKHFLDLCSTVQRCVTTCTAMRNRWWSHLLSCPLQLGWAMLPQKMRLLVANLQIQVSCPGRQNTSGYAHVVQAGDHREWLCVSRNTTDLFFVSSWHLKNVIRSKWKVVNSKDVIWTCNLASFHGNNIKKERNRFFED